MRRAGALDRAHADRVQAPALPPAQPAPGAVEGADPRPRLGLRLRRRRQRRRDLHLLPAQEGRRRRAAADPHRARRRLQPCARRRSVAAVSPARPRSSWRCWSLVAAGLVVAGLVVVDLRRSCDAYLTDRVDQQLSAGVRGRSSATSTQRVDRHDPTGPTSERFAARRSYVAGRATPADAAGAGLARSPGGNEPLAGCPTLPAWTPQPARPATLSTRLGDGGTGYRVRVDRARPTAARVVVAVPARRRGRHAATG